MTTSVPDEATRLHEEGRRLGAAGKHAAALAMFDRAALLAPAWPYPPYDKAFTLLLMGKDADALAAYQEVDALAPRGFFTSKTAVWALQAEARTRFPKGTYASFLKLDWLPASAARTAVDAFARGLPAWAPIYTKLAKHADTPEHALALLDTGLALDCDVETRGMLALNRALVLRHLGKDADADAALRELLALPGVTQAAEVFAAQLLRGSGEG